jgi:hypothetical protein
MWKFIAEKAAKPRKNMIKLRKAMVIWSRRGAGWRKFNLAAARSGRFDGNVIAGGSIGDAIPHSAAPAKQ